MLQLILNQLNPFSLVSLLDESTHMRLVSQLIFLCDQDSRFKIQYAFIRQEHNIIYNHMNENNIRLETSTKEQKNRYHRRHLNIYESEL